MPSHLSAADLEDALRFLQLQVSEPRELEARISAAPERQAHADNAYDAALDAKAAWEADPASKPHDSRDIAELGRLDDAAESALNDDDGEERRRLKRGPATTRYTLSHCLPRYRSSSLASGDRQRFSQRAARARCLSAAT